MSSQKLARTHLIDSLSNLLEKIFSICHKHIAPHILASENLELYKARHSLHQAYEKMIDKFDTLPFVAVLLNWLDEPGIDVETTHNMHTILSEGLLKLNAKSGLYLTVADAKKNDLTGVVDKIRSTITMTHEEREQVVETYFAFLNWLSWETYGYFPRCEDFDLIRTKNRFLTHALFIKFLSFLGIKEQAVAKLLYFGERRTLEDVLRLEIEQINFDTCVIQYSEDLISYPLHVITNIQQIIDSRKSGRVFLGRQNAPLNASTIFRNFKDAAVQAGVGESFCPSALTANF